MGRAHYETGRGLHLLVLWWSLNLSKEGTKISVGGRRKEGKEGKDKVGRKNGLGSFLLFCGKKGGGRIADLGGAGGSGPSCIRNRHVGSRWQV